MASAEFPILSLWVNASESNGHQIIKTNTYPSPLGSNAHVVCPPAGTQANVLTLEVLKNRSGLPLRHMML